MSAEKCMCGPRSPTLRDRNGHLQRDRWYTGPRGAAAQSAEDRFGCASETETKRTAAITNLA